MWWFITSVRIAGLGVRPRSITINFDEMPFQCQPLSWLHSFGISVKCQKCVEWHLVPFPDSDSVTDPSNMILSFVVKCDKKMTIMWVFMLRLGSFYNSILYLLFEDIIIFLQKWALLWRSNIRPYSNCYSLCVGRLNQLHWRLKKGSRLGIYRPSNQRWALGESHHVLNCIDQLLQWLLYPKTDTDFDSTGQHVWVILCQYIHL